MEELLAPEDRDFYEDDEPIEVVRELASRPSTFVTWAPADVVDVAAAFLDRLGPLDTWRLEKLCYYAQAEHLAREGELLFSERIEAWTNGPVIPDLYAVHRGARTVSRVAGGDAEVLRGRPDADVVAETIERVAARYGGWTGAALSELAHRERPWADARHGLSPGDTSKREISTAALRDYYRALAEIPTDDTL